MPGGAGGGGEGAEAGVLPRVPQRVFGQVDGRRDESQLPAVPIAGGDGGEEGRCRAPHRGQARCLALTVLIFFCLKFSRVFYVHFFFETFELFSLIFCKFWGFYVI